MSVDCYISVAVRSSIVDKFETVSIYRKDGLTYREEKYLPIYCGSDLRDYLDELQEKWGLNYNQSYFNHPLDLERDSISGNKYQINAYMIPVSVLSDEADRLVNSKIEKTRENRDYYDDLVEQRLWRVSFLYRLLGQIECFDPSYKTIDRYIVFWFE